MSNEPVKPWSLMSLLKFFFPPNPIVKETRKCRVCGEVARCDLVGYHGRPWWECEGCLRKRRQYFGQ